MAPSCDWLNRGDICSPSVGGSPLVWVGSSAWLNTMQSDMNTRRYITEYMEYTHPQPHQLRARVGGRVEATAVRRSGEGLVQPVELERAVWQARQPRSFGRRRFVLCMGAWHVCVLAHRGASGLFCAVVRGVGEWASLAWSSSSRSSESPEFRGIRARPVRRNLRMAAKCSGSRSTKMSASNTGAPLWRGGLRRQWASM